MLAGSQGELRNQMMLNLARDDVRDYRFTVLDKLATDYNIAYFKWDMNRSFSEPGWPEAAPGDERKLWVRYTQNLYSIDRLRAKHPKLEIESCSGGGGRIDLAILKRVDEVWTFDDTEAFDRLRIQEGFTQAYAPKIMSRVGNRCTEYERPHDAVAVPLSCRNARRIRNWRGPEPLDRSRFCAL